MWEKAFLLAKSTGREKTQKTQRLGFFLCRLRFFCGNYGSHSHVLGCTLR